MTGLRPARRALLRAALFACLAVATPALAERLPEVDALVAPLVGVDAPGIAVLVAQDGEVLHAAGYGLADIEAGTPVTLDTLFDLASVSKQMTALAAALLVAEGALDPKAPVAEVLDVPPVVHQGARRPIVLDDLVRHTSGLPDYLDDAPGLDFDEATSDADVLAWLADMPLDAEPGATFAYSNTGYLVLGAVVAAAEGVDSLDAALQARVFGPLTMISTASGAPADPARRAAGYAGTDGDFEPSAWDTSVEGDGSIWTSLADLARYEAALAGGALIPDGLHDALFANGRFADGGPLADEDEDGAGYGWGWSLYGDPGRAVAAHGGSWYGTATYYYRGLDTGLSVIVLANGEDLDAESLAWEIADALERARGARGERG
ncbi:serine hydrolase domain-containing protein [Salinarimonas sp.]|uniref:serine hydrolase domain-containing protein n=1 Tax=Salinarimonas sp. TaxID=2766526 RepID=UPI0032D92FA2